MQTDRGELRSPADWFLIACEGDLVLKLAHDLNVGEDEVGDLVLNPSIDDALLKVACIEGELTLQVLTLDMTLSVAGERSVQYFAIDSDGPVRVRLPHNALSLSRDILDGGRQRHPGNAHRDFLDIALMRAIQPAITTERMSLSTEVEATVDSLEEMIGPLTEVDVIDHEDYLQAARLQVESGPGETETIHQPIEPLTSDFEPGIEQESPAPLEVVADSSRDQSRPRSRHFIRVAFMTILGLMAALISLSLAE